MSIHDLLARLFRAFNASSSRIPQKPSVDRACAGKHLFNFVAQHLTRVVKKSVVCLVFLVFVLSGSVIGLLAAILSAVVFKTSLLFSFFLYVSVGVCSVFLLGLLSYKSALLHSAASSCFKIVARKKPRGVKRVDQDTTQP